MRVLPGRKNGIKVLLIEMHVCAADLFFWKQRLVEKKNKNKEKSKSDVLAQVCSLSTEVEAGTSGVHGHPQLFRELKANLSYMKLVSKQTGSVRWLSVGKVPGAKPDKLSSVSRNHMWEN